MTDQCINSLHPVKAILFDLDGTLVHSNLDFVQIRKDISCPEGQDVLSFLDGLSPKERLNADEMIMQHELADALSTQLISGADHLLERLKAYGLKTAIITRNSFEATQIKIQRSGLQMEQILTREDAPAKPKPDALLYFCKHWDLQPHECVYVGDYLYDLQAANNAKMHSCLFWEEKNNASLPKYSNLADFICQDFAQFEEVLNTYLAEKHF